MAAALIRCQRLGVDLLFRGPDARLQRLAFPLGRSIPVEQRASLFGCEPATRQLPAMQVLLQLFLRVRVGRLVHLMSAFEHPSSSSAACAYAASRRSKNDR